MPQTSLTTAPAEVDQAYRLFHPAGVFLNTATTGLPPDPSWQALQQTWADYRAGAAQGSDYDAPIAAARDAFAQLASVPAEQVAVGSQASAFVGLVAASLPEGSEVLTATGDFTSVLFPFLARERLLAGSLTVREVPVAEIADEITDTTTLVAVSAVQSADGTVADLGAITEACARTGCWSLLDTTQAMGWFPVPAGDFDFTVTSGYKWLLAPRGTAFLTIRPERMDQIVPITASWYAGENRWSSIYGAPLRLADTARRYDLSPVWHSWVGAAASLELLLGYGVDAIHAHNVGLANAFRSGLGLPASDSAIISLGLRPGGAERVQDAKITAAMRAGRLRVSFHLNNSQHDVDRAVDALAGYVQR